MSQKPEPSTGKMHFGQREDLQTRIHVDQYVEAIEIDLSRPRLILILGRTSKGHLIERHMKITEKEKLVMV